MGENVSSPRHPGLELGSSRRASARRKSFSDQGLGLAGSRIKSGMTGVGVPLLHSQLALHWPVRIADYKRRNALNTLCQAHKSQPDSSGHDPVSSQTKFLVWKALLTRRRASAGPRLEGRVTSGETAFGQNHPLNLSKTVVASRRHEGFGAASPGPVILAVVQTSKSESDRATPASRDQVWAFPTCCLPITMQCTMTFCCICSCSSPVHLAPFGQ